MLDFFRRHQRYFFVVITIVIVISFSFFGTYNSMTDSPFREQIAFRTLNGTDVTRHELDEMVLFLGTDAHDKLIFGGGWGPNFLNDGVIRKDFLETGLAKELALAYANEVQIDLIPRLDKERRYAPYANPKARFVGVESVWSNFAPEMASYYHAMRVAQDPTSSDALQARVSLFLMERQFPASLLRQVLRYQEKQFNWLTPDSNLDFIDLSLFGYHTVEDWFGPRFVRIVAQFIMNAAVIAERQGYHVSKTDALADLIHNAEISFQQNARNPNVGVKNSHEYFNEQLRRLGLDQNAAAKMWQQVMLFRRVYQDMGSSVFVDPFTFDKLDAYAYESVSGELYRLPKDLRIANYKTLQKFEVYLDSVSKRSDEEKNKLALPTTFLTADEVAKKTPELVEKRYLLDIAQVDKKILQGNIGVKDTWNWEASDKGWELIVKQFPELGTAKVSTRDERFAALDNLDDKTRGRVDSYARSAIVDEHPEWLEKALQEAQSTREVVSLHPKGGSVAFAGLENGKELMVLLDAAPLAAGDANKAASPKLLNYTADNKTYYRIAVIDRAPKLEVLTFAAANQQGVLDQLLDTKLDAYYLTIRDANPKEFQRDDKSWKPLADVRDNVANRYFAKVLKSIQTTYAAAQPKDKAPQEMIGDYAATLRLFPYVKDVKDKIQKNPDLANQLTREPIVAEKEEDKLVVQLPLADQWKLERLPYDLARSSPDQSLDKSELFAMANDSWTKVNTPANGDLNFFHMNSKGESVKDKKVASSISQARRILSDDAQQKLMLTMLKQIQAKKAISVEYLNVVAEVETPKDG